MTSRERGGGKVGKRMSQMEVVTLLREIALDYRHGSPEDRALTAAADALETEAIVRIDASVGQVQMMQRPEEIPLGAGL